MEGIVRTDIPQGISLSKLIRDMSYPLQAEVTF